MKALIDTGKLVLRFNEEEALWDAFQGKRRLRKWLHAKSNIPAEILDEIDWREAKNEYKRVSCVGSF